MKLKKIRKKYGYNYLGFAEKWLTIEERKEVMKLFEEGNIRRRFISDKCHINLGSPYHFLDFSIKHCILNDPN